jgi:hypothetical protein
MPIRYEYNSTCCNHLYMETRKVEDAQVVTKCNVCGQSEYVLSNEVVLEDILVPEQSYEYPAEELSPQQLVNKKLIDLGLTQEEINLLIQESTNP